ncbi:MAG TPA: sugar ABC transporter permease [Candidatus Limiplasma sp.]|nr:sugar ABC transporter permease [Candidatus Limiplasma sp.]
MKFTPRPTVPAKAGRSRLHIVQTLLALFLLICFLMPMFEITAWKSVSLKNGAKGNGITMLTAANTLADGLAGVVRKAKLADGVETTVGTAAQSLRWTGIGTLCGLLCAAAMFCLSLAENLGVRLGKRRKALFAAMGIATLALMAAGFFGFAAFRQAIADAAAVSDEALAKVTAKLYQDDAVPAMTVTPWAYMGVLGMAAMVVLQFVKTGKTAFRKSLLWFVLPMLAMYTAFVIVPSISSVYLGFTSYDGITDASMRFVGFENYKDIFQSARFHSATVNTVVIAFSFTLLVNLLALLLAIAVDCVRWMKNVFRSCFYLPVLISGIIAGFIWRIMFNYSFGVINFVLNVLGTGSLKFIDTMPNALLSIIFVLLWKNAGYYMIIYLAALQSIPFDLMEAASIDGANSRQRFRHITIPMLAGSFTINLTLALINGLKIFDEIAILTDGGPGFSTETITYMVYKVAFGEMRQGYGTAMAVILFLMILVLGGVQSTLLRKREVQV